MEAEAAARLADTRQKRDLHLEVKLAAERRALAASAAVSATAFEVGAARQRLSVVSGLRERELELVATLTVRQLTGGVMRGRMAAYAALPVDETEYLPAMPRQLRPSGGSQPRPGLPPRAPRSLPLPLVADDSPLFACDLPPRAEDSPPAPASSWLARRKLLHDPRYRPALARAKAKTLQALRVKPTADWQLVARGHGSCRIPEATLNAAIQRSDDLWHWGFSSSDPFFWVAGLIKTVAAPGRSQLEKTTADALRAAGERVYNALVGLEGIELGDGE
jgi:hypothetical protein